MIRTSWHGDPAWIYRAGPMEVVILPERGGKLASIRHHGREWLTQPQRPLLPLDALPAFLVDGDMFGWDECAPTIDDCEVMGRRLPLHGEVWNQPWTDAGDGWLGVRGRAFDYELRRRLTISDNGFRLDYHVTAGERMPFLWAAHPQFAATPQSRVIFGHGSEPLIDRYERGFWTGTPPGTPIHLGDMPPNRHAKLFIDPGIPADRAALVQADGARMDLRWDAAIAPYLGVWMDRGGVGPVDTAAIEPMTSYADSLAAAVNADRVLWLTPGIPVDWWVELSFAQP